MIQLFTTGFNSLQSYQIINEITIHILLFSHSIFIVLSRLDLNLKPEAQPSVPDSKIKFFTKQSNSLQIVKILCQRIKFITKWSASLLND